MSTAVSTRRPHSTFPTRLVSYIPPALLCLALSNSLLVAQENPFANQYITSLKQAGISATKEELAAFLKQHHIAPEAPGSTSDLIKQLGDDNFFVREAAMQKLLQAASRDAAALETAAKSTDPEVRWRVKVVLEQATNKPKGDLLYAAFVVIHNQKVVGLTDEILGCAPICGSDHLKQALSRALEVSAVADDAPKLRKALSSQDVITRSAAVAVLSKLAGDDAKADLQKLLKDPDESVRLLVAEQLAKSGMPEALQVLGNMLDSETTVIRVRSAQILRATLKTELPYSAFAPTETRKKQAEALRTLIKEQTK